MNAYWKLASLKSETSGNSSFDKSILFNGLSRIHFGLLFAQIMQRCGLVETKGEYANRALEEYVRQFPVCCLGPLILIWCFPMKVSRLIKLMINKIKSMQQKHKGLSLLFSHLNVNSPRSDILVIFCLWSNKWFAWRTY